MSNLKRSSRGGRAINPPRKLAGSELDQEPNPAPSDNSMGRGGAAAGPKRPRKERPPTAEATLQNIIESLGGLPGQMLTLTPARYNKVVEHLNHVQALLNGVATVVQDKHGLLFPRGPTPMVGSSSPASGLAVGASTTPAVAGGSTDSPNSGGRNFREPDLFADLGIGESSSAPLDQSGGVSSSCPRAPNPIEPQA